MLLICCVARRSFLCELWCTCFITKTEVLFFLRVCALKKNGCLTKKKTNFFRLFVLCRLCPHFFPVCFTPLPHKKTTEKHHQKKKKMGDTSMDYYSEYSENENSPMPVAKVR